ncbi:MAG: hypothetical protein QOJ59_3615 [Thermomicrobiales bacterium]|nr:hypothetical protein [Thermomicrobiales bacterium]
MLRARPVMRTRAPIRVVRRRRRWQRVSWWYSLLLVLPIALFLADQAFGIGPERDKLTEVKAIPAVTIRIADAASGQAIAGADIRAGIASTKSDERGVASLPMPSGSVIVTVSHTGYEPVYGRADGSIAREQTVSLRALPAEQAQGEATQPDGAETQNPPGESTESTAAPQSTEAADAPANTPAPTATAEDAAPVAGELTGKVTTEDGNPIRGALVAAGDVRAKTKRDGSFKLSGAPDVGELVVSASGYADTKLSYPVEGAIDIALVRQQIEAVYLSGVNAGNPDIVDQLIKLADDTEVNAIVVDLKEDYVWYDTSIEFFREAEAVNATYDPKELVTRLHEHDIYAIARIVVFNDPIVAENRPDLAVTDENGGVWRGAGGGAWVNPFNQELWQPNIDMALEAAAMGFDEVQYDYIRFPSDGDLTTADFGPDYSEEARVGAIVDFLKLSKKALEPTGAKLAVDIFGIVAIYGDDQGIGQRLADIAPHVDYVCPMIYPSHFDASSIDVGGEPNDLPYETIELSLAMAKKKMPGMELKLRPWLQDFNLGRDYTADDVRAQIRATDDADASGWMLWNAANEYTDDALDPAS